ncbi:hypothetical protein DsansV1_C03g0033981 [Dioscorea sansibarensis]
MGTMASFYMVFTTCALICIIVPPTLVHARVLQAEGNLEDSKRFFLRTGGGGGGGGGSGVSVSHNGSDTNISIGGGGGVGVGTSHGVAVVLPVVVQELEALEEPWDEEKVLVMLVGVMGMVEEVAMGRPEDPRLVAVAAVVVLEDKVDPV